jgi:hypothetical protein
MRTTLRLLVLILTSVLAALALTVPAQAAASPYCGITWGSLAKGDSPVDPGAGVTFRQVRTGQHTCYDRVVIDLNTTRLSPDWHVQYVPAVTEDPSGRPVPLRGGAYLLITFGTNADTAAPANPRELASTAGFRTLRQVAWAGSFEGVTSIAVGVRARLPFRVLTIGGPADGQERLVLDIAHRW